MEVHHHSHHGKKKWTEYFWEFLMLFLAVFCGFLAEYKLEHTIEHLREVQYMETLLEDLYSDTAEIHEMFEVGVAQKEAMDSVIEFMNTESIKGNNVVVLYQLLAKTGRIIKVKFENRTSSQLRNAGGMRMVRKKDVADSIMRYWQQIETCDDISERLERFGDERGNIGLKLFDRKFYIRSNIPFQPVAGVKKNAALITSDPALLAEFTNRTSAINEVLFNYLFSLQEARLKAKSLISVLKQRYHLK